MREGETPRSFGYQGEKKQRNNIGTQKRISTPPRKKVGLGKRRSSFYVDYSEFTGQHHKKRER